MFEKEKLIGIMKAAHRAGTAILEHYHEDVHVKSKTDGSPVTQADLASDAILHEHLKTFNYPILSEESPHEPFEIRKRWKRYWCVDPLDGTREFIKRNGEFVISIALMEDNRPIFGLIYQPTSKTYWLTWNGSNYRCVYGDSIDNESFEMDKLPAPVNYEPVIIVSHAFAHNQTNMHVQQRMNLRPELRIRTMGSALKFCQIAEGKAEEYPRFAPTMEWDTAAGDALLNNIGKQVLHWKTKQPLEYNKLVLKNEYFLVE